MYTKEQAEKDQARFEQMADDADKIGKPLRACLYRLEAAKCMGMVGKNKPHRPNLDPSSPDNPAHCMDCGKRRDQWGEDEECDMVPMEIKVLEAVQTALKGKHRVVVVLKKNISTEDVFDLLMMFHTRLISLSESDANKLRIFVSTEVWGVDVARDVEIMFTDRYSAKEFVKKMTYALEKIKVVP